MPQLLLWPGCEGEVRRKKMPVRLCKSCKKKLPRKPRSQMPLSHAVETVRGIMIDRLDRLCAAWLDGDGKRYHLTEIQWLDLFQSLQLALFPDEFGDGPEVVPDPAGRMDIPPVLPCLVPRRPTTAIYARHLLEIGRASQINASLPGVFTDAELARLGGRQSKKPLGA